MFDSQFWYVQTTFGILLGPMPDETLAEMARSGELISKDLVRKGADGKWTSASELPELFGSSRVVSTDEIPVLDKEKVEPQPPRTAAVTESIADELTLVKAEIDSDFQAIPEEQIPIASSTPQFRNPQDEKLPDASQLHGRCSPRRPRTIQSKSESTKQSPSRKLAIVVVYALVIAWWSWPRTNRKLCDRLLAIRTQLIECRDNPHDKDKTKIEVFVSQAIAELDAQIPGLERKASSGNREAQYLLLASRDCLMPMLNNASHPQEQLEAKLDNSLWALRKFYDGQPLDAPKPPEVSKP